MIYGTGGKALGEVQIKSEKCPSCEEQGNLFLHGFARYFHIFWIPVFPYKKKMIVMCHSCEAEIKKKDRSQSLKDKIALEKGNFSIPLYLFIGLAIIIGFITFLEYNSRKHKGFVKDRIHNLQQDDVIVIKLASDEYLFGKVESVSNGEITMKNSNYTLNQSPTQDDYFKGIQEKEDFFDNELYIYTQKTIDSLHTIGEIDIFELNQELLDE